MAHHSTRRQAGFTLMELMLYIAVLGSLLAAVAGFFGVAASARIKNQAVYEVDSQGSFAIETIGQAIRGSSLVTSPTITANANSLTLATATPATNPTVFSLNNGTLQVKEGSAAAVSLTNDKVAVSNLTFTNLSRAGTPGLVRISMTISRQNPGGRAEFDYTRTFLTSMARRQP